MTRQSNMTDAGVGRVGKPTGLSQAEPVSRLGPSGFDPSRVTALMGQNSCLRYEIKQLRELVLHAYWEGWDDGWSSGTACPLPVPFTEEEVARQWQSSNVCRALEAVASAIEARRAATAETGAVHESAVANGETPEGNVP